jgi:hypothetical protein
LDSLKHLVTNVKLHKLAKCIYVTSFSQSHQITVWNRLLTIDDASAKCMCRLLRNSVNSEAVTAAAAAEAASQHFGRTAAAAF